MHFNSLFALAVACALLNLVSGILLVDSAGALTAATITLGTTTNAATAAAALAVGGALAAAGVLAAARAASSSGKRAAPTCLPVSNPELFITLAANSDKLGCGMRLVCELEATPDQALSHEEKLILSLFGRAPNPVTFDQLNTPKAGFQYAAYIGAKASSPAECASTFNQCPFDRSVMMRAFHKNGTNGL